MYTVDVVVVRDTQSIDEPKIEVSRLFWVPFIRHSFPSNLTEEDRIL